MELPYKIREIIGQKDENISDIGLSDASVYIYDDMVLKIQHHNIESDREYNMLRWLEGKLPVPHIIEHIIANKLSYLLMHKCSGKIACDQEYMQQPKYQSELLASALNDIWQVDWTMCPYKDTLEFKLQQAEHNVIHNLIDFNDCEPDTFSKNGFKNPEALLTWLKKNRPEEELVISHGDFCLPNILFNDGVMTGLIDLGRSGVADKWCDIALCYRSIKNNFSGKFNHKWPGYSDLYLFDALQVKPDWEKIRYYTLLDELF